MQRHHPVPAPPLQWARWGLLLRLARWVLWGLLDRWDPRLRQVPQVLLYLSGRWALWDLGRHPYPQVLLAQQRRWGQWIPQVL